MREGRERKKKKNKKGDSGQQRQQQDNSAGNSGGEMEEGLPTLHCTVTCRNMTCWAPARAGIL